VSLLLHLISTVLVFFLFRKLGRDDSVSLIVAAAFALHPMHVESVAWASEQKDLLYTGFFLGALISYVAFAERNALLLYASSLGLFLLALLSKGMAVPLPAVLILIDYLRGRKLTARSMLEKIPFIVLAGVFLAIAVHAQQKVGAIMENSGFSTIERLPLACYAALLYVVKLLLPGHFSAYYPYPAGSAGTLPPAVWLSGALFLALLAAAAWSARKTPRIVFGAGFFLATIAMVLQILPVGGALMADRYSYLSSIGIFYLAGESFRAAIERLPGLRRALAGTLIVWAVVLAFLSFTRSAVWKDSVTLWTDMISQYPRMGLGYAYRGGGRALPGDFTAAMADLDSAIALAPDLWLAYFNKGFCYASIGRHGEAVTEYTRAIKLREDVGSPFRNRGISLSEMGRYTEAIRDFTVAISLDPSYPKPYFNRAYASAMAGDHEAAVKDYARAIEMHYLEATAYFNRGSSLAALSRYSEAVADYGEAIRLDPSLPEPYYNRGNVQLLLRDYRGAISDYTRFLSLRPENAEALLNRGLARYQSGDARGACSDLARSAELGSARAKAAYAKICR